MADNLAATGSFWRDTVDRGEWHFESTRDETLVVGRMALGDVSAWLTLADQGTEKTVGTSLPHARADDAQSARIKAGIHALSRDAGYGVDMVYSVVHDLLKPGHPDSRALGATLGLGDCYLKLHKQRPGQVWPLHVDNYHAFRAGEAPAGPPLRTRRFIIALSDWCWGQMFQLGNAMWTRWQVGDFVEISAGAPHSSANASPLDRYSLVVTGRDLTP